MKTVLVVGHFWPYHKGGSKRMLGLAKYLPEFGWEPIILSGELQTMPEIPYRVIETPSANRIVSIKKALHLKPQESIQGQVGIPSSVRDKRGSPTSKAVKMIEATMTYPDVEAGWKPHALKAARDILSREKIDSVISVWPIVTHLISRELKYKHRIPWIADFPDRWSDTYGGSYGRIRNYFDRRLEKKTLRLADILVTSSLPQSLALEKLHNREHVHTIKIGFDPEMENEPPMPLTRTLSITYTGIYYREKRNPAKFLTALGELISDGRIDPRDLEVRFYGKTDGYIEKEINSLGLSAVVKQFGEIPWLECLNRQRESQLLLHLNWEDKNEKGVYSGKLPEYLAAKRPVISVGGWGNDVTEELLNETKVGAYCMSVEDAKIALIKYYSEYKEKGEIKYSGDEGQVNKYSYREMAKEFSQLLNSLT